MTWHRDADGAYRMNVQVRHRLSLVQLTQALATAWRKDLESLVYASEQRPQEVRNVVHKYLSEAGTRGLVGIDVSKIDKRYTQAAVAAFGAPWPVEHSDERAGR